MYLFTDIKYCCRIFWLPQEANNEYSHLDPEKKAISEEIQQEEDEDPYMELGELEANDLMQFAYQIATGMVSPTKHTTTPRIASAWIPM